MPESTYSLLNQFFEQFSKSKRKRKDLISPAYGSQGYEPPPLKPDPWGREQADLSHTRSPLSSPLKANPPLRSPRLRGEGPFVPAVRSLPGLTGDTRRTSELSSSAPYIPRMEEGEIRESEDRAPILAPRTETPEVTLTAPKKGPFKPYLDWYSSPEGPSEEDEHKKNLMLSTLAGGLALLASQKYSTTPISPISQVGEAGLAALKTYIPLEERATRNALLRREELRREARDRMTSLYQSGMLGIGQEKLELAKRREESEAPLRAARTAESLRGKPLATTDQAGNKVWEYPDGTVKRRDEKQFLLETFNDAGERVYRIATRSDIAAGEMPVGKIPPAPTTGPVIQGEQVQTYERVFENGQWVRKPIGKPGPRFNVQGSENATNRIELQKKTKEQAAELEGIKGRLRVELTAEGQGNLANAKNPQEMLTILMTQSKATLSPDKKASYQKEIQDWATKWTNYWSGRQTPSAPLSLGPAPELAPSHGSGVGNRRTWFDRLKATGKYTDAQINEYLDLKGIQ